MCKDCASRVFNREFQFCKDSNMELEGIKRILENKCEFGLTSTRIPTELVDSAVRKCTFMVEQGMVLFISTKSNMKRRFTDAESFPSVKKVKIEENSCYVESFNCPICYKKVTINSFAVLPCGHVFHKKCCEQSIEFNGSCPMDRCRYTKTSVHTLTSTEKSIRTCSIM